MIPEDVDSVLVGQVVIRHGDVSRATAEKLRTPRAMVDAYSTLSMKSITGRAGVTPGGLIFMMRGTEVREISITCLRIDMVAMAALAQEFKPQLAMIASSGMAIPNNPSENDSQFNDRLAASLAGKGEAIVGNRVVVVAARDRRGRCALRLVTPVLGPDGKVAKFTSEDESPKSIREGRNPCKMLEALFLWGKKGKAKDVSR